MKRDSNLYVAIYLLTVLDIFFTSLGLKKGIIEEANPLLSPLFMISIGLTSMIILIVSGALLIFLYRVRHKVAWMNSALWILIGAKAWVLGMHVNWITKVI